jgi:hypothetical protein
MALEAAHDVEVGDLSFAGKNYNGALLRYYDALGEKPGDLSIHVWLGRVLEKLHQVPEAIEQYTAAQKLADPKKCPMKLSPPYCAFSAPHVVSSIKPIALMTSSKNLLNCKPTGRER